VSLKTLTIQINYHNGGVILARKELNAAKSDALPMLKTVEQMSRISGLGENKLRELMNSGELEFIQNGNRRLIADSALWDWYNRAKTSVKSTMAKGA
jgi:hypothetical protein